MKSKEELPSDQQLINPPKNSKPARQKLASGLCSLLVTFAILMGICSVMIIHIILNLRSYIRPFTFFADLPSAPPEYRWTATPLPTETPIPESSKEKWLAWKNLKITLTNSEKGCIFTENGLLRVNGTVTNNNEFDVHDVNIKGFSCFLEAPCIFGNDPSLSPDENVKNYYTKMVAPFPLPIFTENAVMIGYLPAGATEGFMVEFPKPYGDNYYCDAMADNFSR